MRKLCLFLLFVALWIGDTILTMMFVDRFGVEMEGHPIPRFMMVHFGLIGFGLFKAVMMSPLIMIWKHMPDWIYAILIFIMIPVVYANVIVGFNLFNAV